MKPVRISARFALLVTLILLTVNPGKTSDAELRLIRKLFDNYTAFARPVKNDSDAINVTFGLSLSQIIDVDERNQLLTISAWIRQIWVNPLLTWNRKDFNNISSININRKKVWLPDIVLYNNADEDKTFGGNLDQLNTRVILESDGKSKWLAPIILRSKCPINVEFFPFDTQKCELKFGSWTYDGLRLNLMLESDHADLSKYSGNSEWHLDSLPCVRHSIYYYCCPEPYVDVTFTLILKRRSLFYMINLIFPIIIINSLTMLSFLLPAESGERISLAITLLLAMTVFMLVVADIIPPTSDVIPLVGAFFSVTIVEVVMMIIVLCYVMKLYHKGPTDPAMPLWMRKLVLEWLSYKLRIRKKHQLSGRSNLQNMQKLNEHHDGVFSSQIVYRECRRRSSNISFRECQRRSSNISYYDKTAMEWFPRYNSIDRRHNSIDRRRPSIANNKRPDIKIDNWEIGNVSPTSPKSLTMTDLEMTSLNRKIDILIEKLLSDEKDAHTKNEWRICAQTIDRFLLISFFAILLVTILSCFLNAPPYVS